MLEILSGIHLKKSCGRVRLGAAFLRPPSSEGAHSDIIDDRGVGWLCSYSGPVQDPADVAFPEAEAAVVGSNLESGRE